MSGAQQKASSMRLVEEPRKPLSMNPKKFAMWLFLATVVMLFASLTSAYIVRRADGNWRSFDLPSMFLVTSILIVMSSISIQLGTGAAKQKNAARLSMWLVITGILGALFLVGQYIGWSQLVESRVFFSFSNPSESFVYVLTGLHGAHLISALIFLLFVIVAARKAHSGKINVPQVEMCATYWHFLGGLWLYLYGFLLYFR